MSWRGENKVSETKVIGYTHYCVYCGQEAKKDSTWEDYSEYVTHYCDCPGALIAIKAKEDYDKAMKTIKYPEDLETKFQMIEYEIELKKLRHHYFRMKKKDFRLVEKGSDAE